jgi:hypothetical protein
MRTDRRLEEMEKQGAEIVAGLRLLSEQLTAISEKLSRLEEDAKKPAVTKKGAA